MSQSQQSDSELGEADQRVQALLAQLDAVDDDRIRDLQNYGYKQGVFLGNAGHVRVTVSPEKLVVDYVKSSPDVPVADNYVIVAH